MIVVSDSSPLIGLASIGQFSLLSRLYTSLHIPAAVWLEVVEEGRGQPGSLEVSRAEWIEKHSPSNLPLVHTLKQTLGAGEAETIAIAIELRADLLLMDEALGRETARHLGLHCMGLLGVLKEAKSQGLIPEIKSYLDELKTRAGFRIKDSLYQRVLTEEGETAL